MKPLKKVGPDIFDDRFISEGIIGCGAYGSVYKVRHSQTGKLYALKRYGKIFDNRILALRTLRQITILRSLKHPKIVKLFDIIPPKDLNSYNDLEVILQYLPFDLKKLCYQNRTISDQQLVKIVYQILIVLKYLNSRKILHRDLKPQNILSDNDYNIKLCDFGLARAGIAQPSFSQLKNVPPKHQLLTLHVVSRWYRAPQIILMQNTYGSSIQMWSVGCITGQLIAQHKHNKKINLSQPRKALFEGKACFPLSPPKQTNKDVTYKIQNGYPQSPDDQISKILQVIGSPTEQQISFVGQQVALNYLKSLPKYERKKPSQIFQYCRPQWDDFLSRALVFDPRKRMTIDQALQHPMFDEIRKQQDFKFEQPCELETDLPSQMPMQQIKSRLNKLIKFYQTGIQAD